MKILTALLLYIAPLFASAESGSLQQTPEDFPQIHLSANPLYTSRGFYMGRILNVRRVRPILSSYEGELMLGAGTSPKPVVDRRCVQLSIQRNRSVNQQEADAQARESCSLNENPWRLSFLSQQLFNQMVDIKDRPVVVYFVNYLFVPAHILTKTRSLAVRAFPIEPNMEIEPFERVRAWTALHPEAGKITGRIIKASMDYSIRKSYEIIVQEGENADNFRAMSVNSGRLFRYISRAMLTGKLLRIEYVRLYRPHASVLSALFNYRTEYRVISVEIAER